MKVSQLFPAKSTRSRKKLPGGISAEQEAAMRQQFEKLITPLDYKATVYFRCFSLNGKQRFWLLPHVETWRDLSIEKVGCVLKYGDWFVKQISKIEGDANDDVTWL